MNTDELWNIVLYGSPMAAAIAMAILDIETQGKISELLVKIKKKRMVRDPVLLVSRGDYNEECSIIL